MKLGDVMKLRYIIMLWRYVFVTHNDQIQVFFLQNALVEYIGVYSDTNYAFFHSTYRIPPNYSTGCLEIFLEDGTIKLSKLYSVKIRTRD